MELFEPLTIKSIRFRNRIVVSPMCQYSSKDGFANDWHLVHLGSRAVGGAGLIIAEASAVSPEGRITAADLGIWKDEHVENLKRIAAFIESQGAVPGIQLAHAGRKASCREPWNGGKQVSPEEGGWLPVAPSAIPFRESDIKPLELGKDDIRNCINDFKRAAGRALAVGFRVLEIHAAHGYLIHTFLSPLSNHRDDEYGGDFSNRIRFLTEIIDAVHTVWPADLPLFVRISASDWAEGGWSLDDSVRLAGILKSKNVDLVDCSSGGLVPYAKIETGPGYQVKFAEAVKQQSGIMTGAVGMINNASLAGDIIRNQQADLVLLARQFLRDPYFALHAAHELGAEMKWPVQYERAKPVN